MKHAHQYFKCLIVPIVYKHISISTIRLDSVSVNSYGINHSFEQIIINKGEVNSIIIDKQINLNVFQVARALKWRFCSLKLVTNQFYICFKYDC